MTFTASNGGTVETSETGRMWVTDFTEHRLPGVAKVTSLEPGVVDALREYFRAEDDERLGRWRWPENPDYVVYPPADFNHYVRVVSERDATRDVFYRDNVDGRGSLMAQAARAYFAAHPKPEPKPWLDAKPGEVWAVRKIDQDHEQACRAALVNEAMVFEPTINPAFPFEAGSVKIAEARRIWPEEEN